MWSSRSYREVQPLRLGDGMIGDLVTSLAIAAIVTWWASKALNRWLPTKSGDAGHKACACLCHTEGVDWDLPKPCPCDELNAAPAEYL